MSEAFFLSDATITGGNCVISEVDPPMPVVADGEPAHAIMAMDYGDGDPVLVCLRGDGEIWAMPARCVQAVA